MLVTIPMIFEIYYDVFMRQNEKSIGGVCELLSLVNENKKMELLFYFES